MTDIKTVIAVVSLLHEPARVHSATRKFRGRPVLDWTLRRLNRSTTVDVVAVHCWEDQLAAVNAVAANSDVGVIDRGNRAPTAAMRAMTTARNWADGWRGGLLGSCDFDLGFDAGCIAELAALHDADAVLLIDPASALIDPELINAVVDHAGADGSQELYFTQAAPGLAPVLLRRELIDRLAVAKIHPGRLLTYFPDQHGVDPVGKKGAVPVSMPIARTPERFKLDSDRQLSRFDTAFGHLNGHLAKTSADGLVAASADRSPDRLPRDVNLEITTRRRTVPIYSPAAAMQIDRPDLSLTAAKKLFADMARADDIRLTLGGVGDPLVHPGWADFARAARDAGIRSIHIETDLVGVTDADLLTLIELNVEVVTVHHPAATSETYRRMMGGDHFAAVLQKVTRLEQAIKAAEAGTPLIAMTFTKTPVNLAEMELWYDYWVRRHGHAVIAGPSDYAGQFASPAVADMAPPRRLPCKRLSTQLTVLSDGKFVACPQDVAGLAPVGTDIDSGWNRIQQLRQCHQRGDYAVHPLCGACREWHRR